MFEKDAEERGNEKIKGNNDLARCSRKSYKDGFKEGAEFGYNKANEWHYVKDGDLPKEEGEYLCAFDFHKRYALDIEFIFINNEDKHYFDNLAWDINKLVAWKEIVPPKESE